MGTGWSDIVTAKMDCAVTPQVDTEDWFDRLSGGAPGAVQSVFGGSHP